MNKKIIALFAILGMLTVASTASLAAGPNDDAPGFRGPGYHRQALTPEQQKDLDKARAEFLATTEGLRKDIAVKRVELSTARAAETPDTAKITQLSNELVDLHAQLAKQRNNIFAKYPDLVDCPFGGPGMGMGGGHHGRGMGLGMGGGMGGGMGAGMGGGACLR